MAPVLCGGNSTGTVQPGCAKLRNGSATCVTVGHVAQMTSATVPRPPAAAAASLNQRLCGDDPVATARRLRTDAARRLAALDCYELGAGSDPVAHYEAASLAFELGDSARLMRALRASVRLAPYFGDGHFEIANVLTSEGRYSEAVTSYRQALDDEKLSDRPMALNNLGNALSDMGAHEDAMRAFKKGLKLAPSFVYLHNGLANVLTAQDRPTDAAATLQKALRHQPDAHYLQFNLGTALRKLKRMDEAGTAFRAALDASPADWRYFQGLGQLHHENGRLSDAIDMYASAQRALSSAGMGRHAPLERDHASALREDKRYDEAEAIARGAIELQPDAPESFTALANILREAGRHEERAHVLQREAESDGRARAAAATPDERAAADAALAAAASSARSGRRRLVIFCRPSYSGEKADKPGSWAWGPRAKERGIGGSESAVVALSRELHRVGWSVEVYASPPLEDVGTDDHGVIWLPHWAYSGSTGGAPARDVDEAGPVDVFVAWRFAEALVIGRDAQRRYLWLHDEVQNATVPRVAIPLLAEGGGGVFVLSKFHRSQLPDYALPHAIITSNGLEAGSVADGANANDRFLYASTPSAGLQLLLTMWPEVRAAIPSARLDVYYGFWPYAMWNEQKHLVAMRKRIEPLLEQPGVHYHGMQSESVLAAAYAAAGFYAYPTDKAETSGIALMKAQSCGCIPITSGQMTSALPETCGEFDLGPRGRPGLYIGMEPEWQADFVRALLAAAARPARELSEYRSRMKASGRARFSWASVAEQWTAIFRNETRMPTETPPPPRSTPAAPAPPQPPKPTRPPPSPPPPSPRGSPKTVFLEVGLEEPDVIGETHVEEDTDAREKAAAERVAALRQALDAQRSERRSLELRVRELETGVASACSE